MGLTLEEKASNRCGPLSLDGLSSSRRCQVVHSFHGYGKTGLERAIEERQLQQRSHSGGPKPVASKCYKNQSQGASLRSRRRECSVSIYEDNTADPLSARHVVSYPFRAERLEQRVLIVRARRTLSRVLWL